MTRLIGLPQEFEKIAAAEAQKHGASLEEYLLRVVAGALRPSTHPREQISEDRATRFRRTSRLDDNSHNTQCLRRLLDA